MASTLVGYFDDYAEAKQTESDLLSSGFGIQEVVIVAQPVEETAQTEEERSHGLWQRLKGALGFATEDERQSYAEAARHGGALLTVRVLDEATNQATEIIERHHPVDLDRRFEEWRGTATERTMGTEETIPIVQEELRVGTRPVQRGAVRIHTYVTEQPVSEQVTLTEEQVFVERTPVERAPAPGEAAFQERTIEVPQMGEEAVVAKEARVVEEVTIGKQEQERTQTVTDTVKKTEVEVERDDAKKKT